MRQQLARLLLCALIGTCALVSSAYAQGHDLPTGTAAVEQPSREVAQKEAIAEWIVARYEAASGRAFDADFRAELKKGLASLSSTELESQTRQSDAGPLTLGASQADLVYNPVTPCRIIDTRLAGGPILPGANRNFFVAGSGFSSQGGVAGSCGVPFGPATAAVINFVAVNPTGAGDLRVTPFGTAMPLASIINYVPGLNLANGPSVKLCDPAVSVCSNDITVQADVSAVDLVADVQGFFASPVATAVENIVLQSAFAACASAGNCSVSSPVCPAGYRLTAGGFQVQVFTSNVEWVYNGPNSGSGATNVNQWLCQAFNNSGVSQNLSCWAVCGRVPGR